MPAIENINYSKLPAHMQTGARDYVEKRCPPGGFLRAVLENNLTQAFGRADDTNLRYMKEWASWLWNQCPAEAWGSKEKVDAWLERS